MEVSELTDPVAQPGGTEGVNTDEHRRRIRTALHHIPLQKLDSGRLVIYDTESKQVRSVNGELDRELLAAGELVETRSRHCS